LEKIFGFDWRYEIASCLRALPELLRSGCASRLEKRHCVRDLARRKQKTQNWTPRSEPNNIFNCHVLVSERYYENRYNLLILGVYIRTTPVQEGNRGTKEASCFLVSSLNLITRRSCAEQSQPGSKI